jgi:hypothetical protein
MPAIIDLTLEDGNDFSREDVSQPIFIDLTTDSDDELQ